MRLFKVTGQDAGYYFTKYVKADSTKSAIIIYIDSVSDVGYLSDIKTEYLCETSEIENKKYDHE